MLKLALKRAIVASGVDRVARAIAGGPGAILMFHRVQDGGGHGAWSANDGLSTAPAMLDRFIATLQAEGYALVTASEAARRLRLGQARARFAALTFDDGYRDNLELLLPILDRHRAAATVYVTSGFIDRTAAMWWFGVERAVAQNDRVTIRAGDHPRDFSTATPAEKTASYGQIRDMFYSFTPAQTDAAVAGLGQDYGIDCHEIADALSMNWDDVRALDRSGLVEIGGHAVSHAPLASMNDDEAWAEIDGGRRRIAEMIGRPPTAFAYPYGITMTVSSRDVGLAARAGYVSAVTTESRPLRAHDANAMHALPRIALGGADDWISLRVRLAGLGLDRSASAGWSVARENAKKGPASRPPASAID